MRRGFTLAELAVASLIILVVLSALSIALVSFFKGSRKLGLQDGAATLAMVEIVNLEKLQAVPLAGVFSRTESYMGNVYELDTSIIKITDDIADVTVEVSSGDSLSVMLTRRFYGE